MEGHKGYTLIELITYLGLFSCTMAIAWGLFAFFIKSYIVCSTRYEIQQDARFAIKYILSEVRSSELSPCSIDIDNKKVLNMKSTEEDAIIRIECSMGNNVLNRVFVKENGEEYENVIAKNIESVLFDYDNADGIFTVTLTACKKNTNIRFTIYAKFYSRIGL